MDEIYICSVRAVAKTVLCLWTVLFFIFIIFFNDSLLLQLASALGAAAGIFKFHTLSEFVKATVKNENRKRLVILNYFIGWVLLVLFFVVTGCIRENLFLAGLSGVFLPTFAVLLTSVTKAVRIRQL
jgi:hypothetical protein